MTKYNKIIHYITEMLPDEATLVDGPLTYTSTRSVLVRYSPH